MYTEEEKKLAQFFVEREGEGVLKELRNINFFEVGIIDSLDMVTLAVFIEKTFGKKLDLTNKESFNAIQRFDTLMELIKKRK